MKKMILSIITILSLNSPASASTECSHVLRQSLLAKFIELKSGANIPNEVLQKLSSQEIGEWITLRIRSQEKVDLEQNKYRFETWKNTPLDFENETQLFWLFNSTVVSGKQIRDNGILNLHQAGESGGNKLKWWRRHIDNLLSGLNLRDNNEIRPKSVYLYLNAPRVLGNFTMPHLFGSGGSMALLKNQVKKRAIWTYGDSLEQTAKSVLRPLNLIYNIIKSVQLIGASKEDKDLYLFKDDNVELGFTNYGTFERKSFWTRSEDWAVKSNVSQQYNEALVFGALKVDDIDSFWISARIPLYSDDPYLSISKFDLENLMPAGLPIYAYYTSSSNYNELKRQKINSLGLLYDGKNLTELGQKVINFTKIPKDPSMDPSPYQRNSSYPIGAN